MKPSILIAVLLSSAAASAPASLKSGIELAHVDSKVRPQDDFYRHVNGVWLANTPIPSDKAFWAPFFQLRDATDQQVRAIVEELSRTPGAHGSEAQKIGDLYSSFMDESKIETLGATPLQAELARIDALKSKDEVAAFMAHLARIGVDSPFGATVLPDAKQSTQYIVYLGQSGLGLPDRDYYLLPDAKFADLRTRYVAHVENTLALAKTPEPKATAAAIMALETLLAQKQWSKVDTRDADKTYNKFELAKLNALTPGFAWAPYLEATGMSGSPGVVVEEPDYFTAWGAVLQETPLSTLKDYFRWQLLRAYAPYLSKAFVDENFAFYGKALSGMPRKPAALEARRRTSCERALGEAIGKVYVQRHFPPEAKARMEVLVDNLLKAYGRSIRELDWMSEGTKQKALTKLAKFHPKIGYPSKWRDYSSLTIAPGDLVGNLMRARDFGARLPHRQARQADRPRGVGHDAADGQRVLQPDAERDRVPGRDPAAAVLRHDRRRRSELRRDRRGDRPRDRPRLRRPGLASSTATATCRAGGPTRTDASSTSARAG